MRWLFLTCLSEPKVQQTIVVIVVAQEHARVRVMAPVQQPVQEVAQSNVQVASVDVVENALDVLVAASVPAILLVWEVASMVIHSL